MKLKKYIQFINEGIVTLPIEKYNKMIDYTLLDNNASDEDIISLCEKAIKYGVKSVCVMPKHVKLAAEQLLESDVLVCTVVSFPSGNNTPEEKLSETINVISDGADEVDMVLNYNLLKEKNWYENINFLTNEDVKPLVNECHKHMNKSGEKVILKVIVESGLLNLWQTEKATEICINAGADFIKTSTGKVQIGAEIDKIKKMYFIIKDNNSNMKIKASGGVRTLEDLENYGRFVDRFGMGYGAVDTLNGLINNSKGY